MASEKTVNYTAEQEAELVARYQAGETVEQLAEAFGKGVRSVVAKLARAGVYKAKEKAVSVRATKAQMLTQIEAKLELATGTLASLEKGEKAAIEALVAAVANF